jgi:hypothetical protein
VASPCGVVGACACVCVRVCVARGWVHGRSRTHACVLASSYDEAQPAAAILASPRTDTRTHAGAHTEHAPCCARRRPPACAPPALRCAGRSPRQTVRCFACTRARSRRVCRAAAAVAWTARPTSSQGCPQTGGHSPAQTACRLACARVFACKRQRAHVLVGWCAADARVPAHGSTGGNTQHIMACARAAHRHTRTREEGLCTRHPERYVAARVAWRVKHEHLQLACVQAGGDGTRARAARGARSLRLGVLLQRRQVASRARPAPHAAPAAPPTKRPGVAIPQLNVDAGDACRVCFGPDDLRRRSRTAHTAHRRLHGGCLWRCPRPPHTHAHARAHAQAAHTCRPCCCLSSSLPPVWSQWWCVFMMKSSFQPLCVATAWQAGRRAGGQVVVCGVPQHTHRRKLTRPGS